MNRLYNRLTVDRVSYLKLTAYNLKLKTKMSPVAYIESPFGEKFGIPRQAGMAPVVCRVVFLTEYRSVEAVRGLEGFDYVWLLWRFDTDGVWHPTVRPPRLGGNERVGVFATRSPFRPNPIGLSSVRLLRVALDEPDSPVLYVEGADLRDHTAIYDIKPYIPYADSHPDVRSGFAREPADRRLEVAFAEGVQLSDELKTALAEVLGHDPRPRYHENPDRVYGMSYAGHEVKFRIDGDRLTVLEASLTASRTSPAE